MRILILEDDDLLGPMLVRALRRRGHQVVLVTNITALTLTLQTMVDEMPDIILCATRWGWVGINPKEPVSHRYYHKGIDDLTVLFEIVES